MATHLERTASLETTASIAKWVLGIFIPLVFGWGAFITINVIAMKQQLADGGNTKLVTELKAPKSPQQLQANLTTVVAQIQTDRVNGTRPNLTKVAALSGALSQVVKDNPQMPEAWQAATLLVSYRSPQPIASQKDCFNHSVQTIAAGQISNNTTGAVYTYSGTLVYTDCTFVLSDVNAFKNSADVKDLIANSVGAAFPVNIQLIHAHLVYRGGEVIPFLTLQCTACTYDFEYPATPPSPVQKLTRALLLASDYSDIKVDTQGAM